MQTVIFFENTFPRKKADFNLNIRFVQVDFLYTIQYNEAETKRKGGTKMLKRQKQFCSELPEVSLRIRSRILPVR